MLVAAAAPPRKEDWHDLGSSDAIATALDIGTVVRLGDEVTGKIMIAMRDFDHAAKRFSTKIGTATVTINCRTRAGRMSVGDVHDGNGRVVERGTDGQTEAGPVNTSLLPLLCSGKAPDQRGWSSFNLFLDRIWPPVPGIGRGW